MPKTQNEIDAIAEDIRASGMPDSLNRWLGMTPETLAESEQQVARQSAGDRNRRSTTMVKAVGPKEQALREQREVGDAPAAGAKPKTAKRPAAKKEAQSKARTPVAAAAQADKKTPSAGRPAEKQIVIKKLLARKNGCTAKEVMAACNWPSVSMPQQAKALDITLHKKKVEGEPTRYADHPLD